MSDITMSDFAFLYGKEIAERLNLVKDLREWSKRTSEELEDDMKQLIDEELRGEK